MRKIKYLFVALFALVSMAVSAQNRAVQQDKFFDQTYVGITAGYDAAIQPWEGVGVVNGLKVGKFITPVVGFEIEGQVFTDGLYKDLLTHRVGTNVLLNLNYLGGYKGKRDRFEVLTVTGLGWQRNYTDYTNGMYTKFGLQLNYNLSQSFYLSLVPAITYTFIPNDKFDVRNADGSVVLGLTYRFKNSHGTRDFALCKYNYTQDDIDQLNAKINEMQARIAKFKQATENRRHHEPRVVEKVVEVPVFATIGFVHNSAEISPIYALNVKTIAEAMKGTDKVYTITGYASEEGTTEHNQALSEARAQAVVDALVAEGVPADRLKVVGAGATTEFGEQLDLNRTVKIVAE